MRNLNVDNDRAVDDAAHHDVGAHTWPLEVQQKYAHGAFDNDEGNMATLRIITWHETCDQGTAIITWAGGQFYVQFEPARPQRPGMHTLAPTAVPSIFVAERPQRLAGKAKEAVLAYIRQRGWTPL